MQKNAQSSVTVFPPSSNVNDSNSTTSDFILYLKLIWIAEIALIKVKHTERQKL